jgi:flavin-dependent dehydrogenase
VNGEDLKTRREPSLEAFALNRIARLPGLGKRTEGTRVIGSARAIGPLRLRARRRASGRVLLAGDAGGFIDPFTGEGVTVALQSGRAAARAILDAADADRARGPSLTRGYEAFWRRRTQVKFRVNRLLQRLIRSERAAHATATALSASPFAANRLVRYFGGQL